MDTPGVSSAQHPLQNEDNTSKEDTNVAKDDVQMQQAEQLPLLVNSNDPGMQHPLQEKDKNTEKDPDRNAQGQHPLLDATNPDIQVAQYLLQKEDNTMEEPDRAVIIKEGCFCWGADTDDMVLKDINFEAKVGKLNGILNVSVKAVQGVRLLRVT